MSDPQISAYEPRRLMTMANEIREPATFFWNMLFGGEEISQSEVVDLDKDDQGLQVAHFTEPDATSKNTDKQSWDTHTFRIPYIKPMKTIKPGDLVSRMPGESIYDGKSMEERHAALAARELADLESRIQRRIELMCSQIVINGQIPILDENGHTLRSTITFPRHSSTMNTLTGSDRWDQSGSDPIGDIEDMQDNANAKTGIVPDFAFMSPEVWKVLRSNTKFMDLLDNVSLVGAFADLTSKIQDLGVRYAGRIMNIPLFVVSTRYHSGTSVVRTVPSNVFGMASSKMGGEVIYGPIHEFTDDGRAISAVAPRVPTSWVTRNPSARMLQVHSAPLPFTKHWNSIQTWRVIT